MVILFVCTANVCRSVMAQALVKNGLAGLGGKIEVLSAGVDVIPNLSPDPNTLRICSSHGLDVTAHRPRQLTPELLDQSDIVLCMANNHQERIQGAYPRYESKVFLLKQFRRQEHVKNPSVEDPIGRSLRYYKKCFREIQSEVERILPFLSSQEMSWRAGPGVPSAPLPR